MTNRFLMSAAVLGALSLAPVPALAQSDVAQIATQMRDPQMQVAVASAVRAMSDAILNMRVAPLAEAIETARDPLRERSDYDRVDPDARLRDYAGRDAEEMPERLSRRLPAMMGAMPPPKISPAPTTIGGVAAWSRMGRVLSRAARPISTPGQRPSTSRFTS